MLMKNRVLVSNLLDELVDIETWIDGFNHEIENCDWSELIGHKFFQDVKETVNTMAQQRMQEIETTLQPL